MKRILSFIVLTAFIFSCSEQNNGSKKLDRAWLDSIIKSSDSSYVKPYYRTDFVTATYYLNRKDSTVCQAMKDSAGIIRQIIIAKKDVRTFFAQYYKNGQLQAELSLDEFGQYHGAANYYYENGKLQSSGDFLHGSRAGEWKNFNEKGQLISTDRFDRNGQPVPEN